ncbi:hypothetical protein [Chitinimonas lacunae]|uniref:DUF304 domain-containing protein n=1 Tax=Chitinimonas lacunae TaxID=1963018 RepID=A0ABV8MWZ0_9NEIS
MFNFPSALTGASLSDLARWLRIEEGERCDTLSLASAWERMPESSPNRLAVLGGAVLAVLVVLGFLLQALFTRHWLGLVLALAVIAVCVGAAWRVRYWFWTPVIAVGDDAIALSYRGWGVPATISVSSAGVSALVYRMRGGQLSRLSLQHSGGALALPISGHAELDKLYFNLLKHLLQKRKPLLDLTAADKPEG